MLYGTVRYVLRADAEKNEVEVPWAGRVVFVIDGEEVRMKFYQVYLVCCSLYSWRLVLEVLTDGLGSFGAVGEEIIYFIVYWEV